MTFSVFRAYPFIFPFVFCALMVSRAFADVHFEESQYGDHYFYMPSGQPANIVVVAHGTVKHGSIARDTARVFLDRWVQFAEDNAVAVLVPVFDDTRFGNRHGGYGGYRGLFGRYVSADEFVIGLVVGYQNALGLENKPFLLYGHSAGAQFAARFIVQHPEKVEKAVLSAPGRYSYPTKAAKWPYGAGELRRTIQWSDGSEQRVKTSGDLKKYAQAAGKVFVLVGSNDVSPQPKRSAHKGQNRAEFAISWISEMNKNAVGQGFRDLAKYRIIPGVGHNSARLTPYAQRALID